MQLMLQYVELLLASPNTSHHEIARELMSELNTQDSTTDANVLRDIDTKVLLPLTGVFGLIHTVNRADTDELQLTHIPATLFH